MHDTFDKPNLPFFLVAAGIAAGTLAASLVAESQKTQPQLRVRRRATKRSEPKKPEFSEQIAALKLNLKDVDVAGRTQEEFLAARYLTLSKLAELNASLDTDELDSVSRELASFHRNCALGLTDASDMQTELNICLRLDPEKPNEQIEFIEQLQRTGAGKVLASHEEFDRATGYVGIARILQLN